MQFFEFYPARFPYSTAPANVCGAYHRACINRFSKTSDWLRSSPPEIQSFGCTCCACSICWLAYIVLLCSVRAALCHPSDSSCPPPPWNGNHWNKITHPLDESLSDRSVVVDAETWDKQRRPSLLKRGRTALVKTEQADKADWVLEVRLERAQRSGPSCWNNELSHLRREEEGDEAGERVGEDSCF